MKGLSWELPVHDVDENAGDSILFKMTRMGVGETGLLTIEGLRRYALMLIFRPLNPETIEWARRSDVSSPADLITRMNTRAQKGYIKDHFRICSDSQKKVFRSEKDR